jgi:hypothetical protein
MWSGAGCQAMKEATVELLKTKILKAWGPMMEKTADAVIEAMGVEWQAVMTKGKARADLKQKIASIVAEKSR